MRSDAWDGEGRKFPETRDEHGRCTSADGQSVQRLLHGPLQAWQWHCKGNGGQILKVKNDKSTDNYMTTLEFKAGEKNKAV
ncbi:Protein of unknown function [Gryllus bimaculatus]|nr:Protein of unknown function [Gryllus bimaculatus]